MIGSQRSEPTKQSCNLINHSSATGINFNFYFIGNCFFITLNVHVFKLLLISIFLFLMIF